MPSGPDYPQVAVFDTAFHQTMPARAFRYAVPEEWYTRYGVRRYGFHGTSHRFVSERAAALLGRPLGELRLVTAHLGNGCSAAAVRDGVSVDTTMGMTPMEGLVMGTRSGDVDPGVFGYLAGETGQTCRRAHPRAEHAKRPAGAVRRGQRHAHRRGRGRAAETSGPARPRGVRAPAGQGDRRAGRRAWSGSTRWSSPAASARTAPWSAAWSCAVWASSAWPRTPRPTPSTASSLAGASAAPAPSWRLSCPTDEELMIARDTARLIAALPGRRPGS